MVGRAVHILLDNDDSRPAGYGSEGIARPRPCRAAKLRLRNAGAAHHGQPGAGRPAQGIGTLRLGACYLLGKKFNVFNTLTSYRQITDVGHRDDQTPLILEARKITQISGPWTRQRLCGVPPKRESSITLFHLGQRQPRGQPASS